jgi:hypothetical protein
MISAGLSLLYRYLFCRNGYGIHSPFVYDLITDVIAEKRPYYCYGRLKRKYLSLRKRNGKFLLKKEYELLFRMANRFKPANSLVMAEDSGLSALYVTAFSKDARCVSADCSIPHNCGNEKYDLIVCRCFTQDTVSGMFECVKDDTVMIVSGIRNSGVERKLWQSICEHPKVSVTIDLYSLGFIFFNPKLHRKNYKSII